nr:nonstructural polyprotein [Hepelivirales sp.]
MDFKAFTTPAVEINTIVALANNEKKRLADVFYGDYVHVPFHLDVSQYEYLQSIFPTRHVRIADQARSHQHPIAAFFNLYAEQDAFNAYRGVKACHIMDIGSSYKNNNGHHKCILINNNREAYRYAKTSINKQLKNFDLFTAKQLRQAAYGQKNHLCVKGAENCDYQAQFAYCINAAYDIPLNKWYNIFARHGLQQCLTYMYLPPSLAHTALRGSCFDEPFYTTRYYGTRVSFQLHDFSAPYNHEVVTWAQYLTHSLILGKDFNIAIEIEWMHGAFAKLCFTRIGKFNTYIERSLPYKEFYGSFYILPNLLDHANRSKYLRNEQLLVVPKDFADKVMHFCLRAVKESYKSENILSYASGLVNKITFNGKILHRGINVSVQEYTAIVFSLTVIASATRFVYTQGISQRYKQIKPESGLLAEKYRAFREHVAKTWRRISTNSEMYIDPLEQITSSDIMHAKMIEVPSFIRCDAVRAVYSGPNLSNDEIADEFSFSPVGFIDASEKPNLEEKKDFDVHHLQKHKMQVLYNPPGDGDCLLHCFSHITNRSVGDLRALLHLMHDFHEFRQKYEVEIDISDVSICPAPGTWLTYEDAKLLACATDTPIIFHAKHNLRDLTMHMPGARHAILLDVAHYQVVDCSCLHTGGYVRTHPIHSENIIGSAVKPDVTAWVDLKARIPKQHDMYEKIKFCFEGLSYNRIYEVSCAPGQFLFKHKKEKPDCFITGSHWVPKKVRGDWTLKLDRNYISKFDLPPVTYHDIADHPIIYDSFDQVVLIDIGPDAEYLNTRKFYQYLLAMCPASQFVIKCFSICGDQPIDNDEYLTKWGQNRLLKVLKPPESQIASSEFYLVLSAQLHPSTILPPPVALTDLNKVFQAIVNPSSETVDRRAEDCTPPYQQIATKDGSFEVNIVETNSKPDEPLETITEIAQTTEIPTENTTPVDIDTQTEHQYHVDAAIGDAETLANGVEGRLFVTPEHLTRFQNEYTDDDGNLPGTCALIKELKIKPHNIKVYFHTGPGGCGKTSAIKNLASKIDGLVAYVAPLRAIKEEVNNANIPNLRTFTHISFLHALKRGQTFQQVMYDEAFLLPIGYFAASDALCMHTMHFFGDPLQISLEDFKGVYTNKDDLTSIYNDWVVNYTYRYSQRIADYLSTIINRRIVSRRDKETNFRVAVGPISVINQQFPNHKKLTFSQENKAAIPGCSTIREAMGTTYDDVCIYVDSKDVINSTIHNTRHHYVAMSRSTREIVVYTDKNTAPTFTVLGSEIENALIHAGINMYDDHTPVETLINHCTFSEGVATSGGTPTVETVEEILRRVVTPANDSRIIGVVDNELPKHRGGGTFEIQLKQLTPPVAIKGRRLGNTNFCRYYSSKDKMQTLAGWVQRYSVNTHRSFEETRRWGKLLGEGFLKFTKFRTQKELFDYWRQGATEERLQYHAMEYLKSLQQKVGSSNASKNMKELEELNKSFHENGRKFNIDYFMKNQPKQGTMHDFDTVFKAGQGVSSYPKMFNIFLAAFFRYIDSTLNDVLAENVNYSSGQSDAKLGAFFNTYRADFQDPKNKSVGADITEFDTTHLLYSIIDTTWILENLRFSMYMVECYFKNAVKNKMVNRGDPGNNKANIENGMTSGRQDTLTTNTRFIISVTGMTTKVEGLKCAAFKGDDSFLLCRKFEATLGKQKKLAEEIGMKVKLEIGPIAEFTAMILTPYGPFPDLIRRTIKVLSNIYIDEQQWATSRRNMRDALDIVANQTDYNGALYCAKEYYATKGVTVSTSELDTMWRFIDGLANTRTNPGTEGEFYMFRP